MKVYSKIGMKEKKVGKDNTNKGKVNDKGINRIRWMKWE